MVYKWCAVPKCTNTSIKSPEKLFINVPRNAVMRKKWMQLARRNPNDIVVDSKVFFCEDHFEMEKDIANYNQYKMGFSQRLLLADGALPSKFNCQDSRKRSKGRRECLSHNMAPELPRTRTKCAKCNVVASEEKNLTFHRFPLPGKHGLSRLRVWAEYCFPDKDWSSEKSWKVLHQLAICSKHFDDSSYTNSARTRLNNFAVPTVGQEPRQKLNQKSSQKLIQKQTLSETKHDTYISVEEPGLDIMENNMDLVTRSDVKKLYLDPNCSTLNEDAEMDLGESPIASTSTSNIDTTTDTKIRLSADQTRILCNFFEENPEVIQGYKQTPESTDQVQIKWNNITPHLNAVGPPRDHKSWAKYVCDMRAKLKRKSKRRRRSSDGHDPVMCDTEDFNEIHLRMLQVLRKDVSSDTQESQDSQTSDLETDDDIIYHDDLNEGDNYEMNTLPEGISDMEPNLGLGQNDLLLNYTLPPETQPRRLFEDEFDYFGKNIAEQLRTLPLSVALETQEMLLSVLKQQRLKMLSGADPLSHIFYSDNNIE